MRRFKLLAILALFGFLAVFPFVFSNPTITTIAVFTLFFAVAATGWNIFSGYTGYISIGHAAFYGLGAYFLALFCQVWNVQGGWPPFLLLPMVGLLTGICAVPIGWVALKTKRYRFLVLTIAIFALCSQIPNLLGNSPLGGAEVSLPIPLWSGDVYNLPFYYIAMILLVLAVIISWGIRRSRYGLALLAIRDDEERALGLAVKTEQYKLAAFVISAIFVSMAGAMNAYYLGFVSPPSAFDSSFNIFVPLLAFLGGIGTLVGPMLGALVAVPLQQYITLQFGAQGWDLILYGACFLLIILFLPEGLLPTVQRKWPLWSKTFNNLIHGQGWAASISHSGAKALTLVGFIRTNRAAHRADTQREKDVAFSLGTSAEPVTYAKTDASQTINERWSGETLYWIPGEQQFQQFITSGSLRQSTTQKLRPIRLIEMPQETVIPSPSLISGGTELRARSSQTEPEVFRSEPAPLASHDERSLGRNSSSSLAALCPRCGNPLRVVQTMVFCRRCGLIVSGQQG